VSIELLTRTIALFEARPDLSAEEIEVLAQLRTQLIEQSRIDALGSLTKACTPEGTEYVQLSAVLNAHYGELLSFWSTVKGTSVSEMTRRLVAIGDFLLSQFSFDEDGKPNASMAIVYPEGIEPRLQELKLSPELFG
jgi:hypothetical protein